MSPARLLDSRRRSLVRFALLAAVVVLALGTAAAPALALPKVTRFFPTRVALSASRDASGTVTVQASFSSPEPRCLSAKRFLQKRFHDLPTAAGGYLLFGGAYSDERGSGAYGLEGYAQPPSVGLMSPTSPAAKSPYVWEATWPGDTSVSTTNFHDPSQPRHYQTTIAAAAAISLGASARESTGQGLAYFKTTYNKGGKHYIVKCGVLKKTESSRVIPL
jgi:hypothetical protein